MVLGGESRTAIDACADAFADASLARGRLRPAASPCSNGIAPPAIT